MRLTHSSFTRALVAAGSAVIVLVLLAAGAHQALMEPEARVPPMPRWQAVDSPTVGEPMPCSELLAQDDSRLGASRDAWFTRC